MGIVIGIDVGGSTTKIVGIDDKEIRNPMFVKATDPVHRCSVLSASIYMRMIFPFPT